MIARLDYITHGDGDTSYCEQQLCEIVNEIVDTVNDIPQQKPNILLIKSDGRFPTSDIVPLAQKYTEYMKSIGYEAFVLLQIPGLSFQLLDGEQLAEMSVEELKDFLNKNTGNEQ